MYFQEVCVQYWPEEKKKQSYGNLTVSNKSEMMLNDSLWTRVFEIYRNGSVAAVSYLAMYSLQYYMNNTSR